MIPYQPQASKERIIALQEAVTDEVAALTKLQLLAESACLATTLALLALKANLLYGQQLARELKPDDWTYPIAFTAKIMISGGSWHRGIFSPGAIAG